MEIENMAWSRLGCWIIHKLLLICRPRCTFSLFCKYGTFVAAKMEHIWHLYLPIMKYETYWYRYPTVAPHGDGLSSWKAKNSRSVCLGPWAIALKLWSFITLDSSKCRLVYWNTKCLSILLLICNASQNNLIFMPQTQQYIQHIQSFIYNKLCTKADQLYLWKVVKIVLEHPAIDRPFL